MKSNLNFHKAVIEVDGNVYIIEKALGRSPVWVNQIMDQFGIMFEYEGGHYYPDIFTAIKKNHRLRDGLMEFWLEDQMMYKEMMDVDFPNSLQN